MSGREAIERKNLGLRSLVEREREKRIYLKAKLAMARKWVVKAQDSLRKFQESQYLLQVESEELRGLQDFNVQ